MLRGTPLVSLTTAFVAGPSLHEQQGGQYHAELYSHCDAASSELRDMQFKLLTYSIETPTIRNLDVHDAPSRLARHRQNTARIAMQVHK